MYDENDDRINTLAGEGGAVKSPLLESGNFLSPKFVSNWIPIWRVAVVICARDEFVRAARRALNKSRCLSRVINNFARSFRSVPLMSLLQRRKLIYNVIPLAQAIICNYANRGANVITKFAR